MRPSNAAKPAPAATGSRLQKREQHSKQQLGFDATLSSLRLQYLMRRFGLEPIRAELVARLAYEVRL